jgi:hypothetical protein
VELYLDDCADANDLVTLLRQAGHLVRTPRSEGTIGATDPAHLAHAASVGSTVITRNPKHFRRLHQEWQTRGQSPPGILLVCEDNVRGKDMEPADIVHAINRLLTSGVPIDNELHVLNHWR